MGVRSYITDNRCHSHIHVHHVLLYQARAGEFDWCWHWAVELSDICFDYSCPCPKTQYSELCFSSQASQSGGCNNRWLTIPELMQHNQASTSINTKWQSKMQFTSCVLTAPWYFQNVAIKETCAIPLYRWRCKKWFNKSSTTKLANNFSRSQMKTIIRYCHNSSYILIQDDTQTFKTITPLTVKCRLWLFYHVRSGRWLWWLKYCGFITKFYRVNVISW